MKEERMTIQVKFLHDPTKFRFDKSETDRIKIPAAMSTQYIGGIHTRGFSDASGGWCPGKDFNIQWPECLLR